jgi:DNA-binding beta-propeller fold protein YncE
MKARFAALILGVIGVAMLIAPATSLAAFEPLLTVESQEGTAGEMVEPYGPAVAPDGDVYVPDAALDHISVFDKSGAFLFEFGSGTLRPHSAAIYGGDVYVANEQANRVDVFSEAGAFLFAFGEGVNYGSGDPDVCTTDCREGGTGDGIAGVAYPQAIAINGAAGHVYVSTAYAGRIDVFSTAGAFEGAWGYGVNTSGSGNPNVCTTHCGQGAKNAEAAHLYYPEGLALLSGGRLAVADPEARRVDIYSTTSGEFLEAFGEEVNPTGEPETPEAYVCTTVCQKGQPFGPFGFSYPGWVAAGPEGGIYVSDENKDRIVLLSSAGAFVSAFGYGVRDGAAEFQVCTAAEECEEEGVADSGVGAVVNPLAMTSFEGDLYVTGRGENATPTRYTVFGEPKKEEEEETGSGTGGGSGGNGSGSGSSSGTGTGGGTGSTGTGTTTPKPSNALTFGALTLNRKAGTAVLAVKVKAAGKLVLKGAGLRGAQAVAKKAGTVKLKVALVGKAKRTLMAKGTAKVTAAITFTPTGGSARTTKRKLTLKLAPPR